MKRGTLFLQVVAAAVLATAAGVLVWQGRPTAPGETIATTRSGQPFRLASSAGGIVDSNDLAGEPYIVYFGFTNCPVICPTTLYELSNELAALGSAGARLKVLFITVDPERDTPDFLATYLQGFDPRIIGLVPTEQQLAEIAKAFGIVYEKVPTSDGSYTMNHTATVFLIDGAGRLLGTLAPDEGEAAKLAKLKRLVAGGGGNG
ncbi:MAG: SCO family protein [Hyphomicrobiaceae bacterium]